MDKDISTMLQEIKTKTRWSEPRIASEIKVSQPTVNRILNGQNDCKASTFRSIVELHKTIYAEIDQVAAGQSDPKQLREQVRA